MCTMSVPDALGDQDGSSGTRVTWDLLGEQQGLLILEPSVQPHTDVGVSMCCLTLTVV